jgi:ATP-dependent helicase/nuclease subunit A
MESELALAETWERWLDTAVADAPAALAEVVSLGVSPATLRELGRALVAERDLLAGLPAPVVEDAGTLGQAARERLLALAAAAPARARTAPDRLARELDALADWVQDTEALPEAEQLTALLTELRFPSPARLGSQAVWGRELLARARTELADLADRVAVARGRRLHNLAAALAAWLTGFVAAYLERMRQHGHLDFHDLLAVTRALLRDRPDVRRDLARRYRTVLVDEFQDTDPLQLEIAFFLAEDPDGPAAASWDEVKLGAGRLFLVGDPKQSIYRFRRADIETYERARAVIERQGAVLQLETNFRSTGRLLAAVNQTFALQMQPPDDGRYQPAYAPLVAAPGAPEGEAPLLVQWPPGEAPPERLSERRAREAAALASLVARGVASRGWTVRDRASGASRSAAYGDVVCLLRALTGVAVYEDAFRAAGVPYRTVGGRHYYARSEVGFALAALAAIDDPHDPVALVAALRSPFFGVPDWAFLEHEAGGGQLSYQTPPPPGAHPALAQAWAVLRDLHGRRVRESATAIVEALYAETEALATYALDAHGDQRVANLLRILDTARALEARGRSTFGALVRWLHAQDAAGYEESESPVVDEGDQVVRLMTVHSAKGLEFPIVVLPALEWDRGPAAPRLVVDRRPGAPALAVSLGKVADFRIETENLPELTEREARREAAEQLRLFYVATTRARDHLVLPLLTGGEPRGFAAFCAPLLDEAFAGVQRVAAPGAAPGPALSSAAAGEGGVTLTSREAWAAARAAALARGARSAAPAPPAPPAGRARDARLALLVRRALALADLGGTEPARAWVERAAAQLGHPGARAALADRLVSGALAAEPYRRAARAPRVFREVPVAGVVAGGLVEDVLDLVFEDDGRLVVAVVVLGAADEGAAARLAASCAVLARAGPGVAEAYLVALAPGGVEVIPVAVTTADRAQGA